MPKILTQIVLSFAIAIVTEIFMDHFYRKPKAQLQLPWNK
jgi:hypothetical protein